ncbi:MAG: 4-(cytidine 5'-diphospho)-2-C-methyl-D-erythritol kinase [Firmicutes bacterium]|nr:4-(cytidine 5'-diphospho)-2-C-methyl-D-erythritol kinase [Bacillota bacterium]
MKHGFIMGHFQEKREYSRGYAKINLTLDVGPRRDDGFHEVSMIMQTIRLWDDVWLTITDGSEVTMDCNIPFLGADDRNIAYRAALLMRERFGLTGGLHIHMEKRIPIAAGLAGGSADTAAVIKGMNRLYGLGLKNSQMMQIGQELGSDVPFCIVGGTCFARGRGEIIQRLKAPMPFAYVVLVKPPFGISTPWSYQMFDKQVITRRPDEPAMEQAIVSGDLGAVGREMVNLLEPAALEKFPILIWLKERLKSHGAQGVMMSGSGPTVYALFREKKTAVEALKDLRSVCPKRYQVLFSQILDQ